MRLMVDTNVLLDALKARRVNAQAARKVLALGYVGEFDLWVSAGQMKDLTYFLTDGGKHQLAEQASQTITQLRQFISFCSLTDADIEEMCRLSWPDLEDSLVEVAARKVGAEAIVTQNLGDFARSSMLVFDCDGLFDYLASAKNLTFDVVDWG